jgi:outer membrane protein OmpA-like peptidoglycan-associated protein
MKTPIRGLDRDAARDTKRAAPAAAPPKIQRREAVSPTTAVFPSTAVPASQAAIPALSPAERAAQSTANPIPAIVHEVAQQPGKPLDDMTRHRFESRLVRDFSEVRIHTGEQASLAAGAIDAAAFTVGRDVVFGANQYQPGTTSGQHLIAHELTHVAQPKTARTGVSHSGDASEREADRTADTVMQDRVAPVQTAAAAAIQREPKAGADSASMPKVSDRLLEHASPFLAAAAGSTTLDGFDTGKAELKPAHRKELPATAHNIQQLLLQYPLSTVTVIGHADTVGTEARNLDLGQLRATAVMNALTELGVPVQSIVTSSVGEAAPQGVQTKDETPNAKNRRVEVRFEPKSDLPEALRLKPPTMASDPPGHDMVPPPPPIDLKYHPKDDGNDGKARDDYFKEIPPLPKGTESASALDVIGRKLIDPVIDAVAGALSKDVRDKIKGAARDAVKSGIAKMARLAAEGAGVKDPQALDAIEKATESAIQQKGSPQ